MSELETAEETVELIKVITDEDYDVIKRDFDKIKATLVAISPFLSSLIRRSRIVLTYQIPTAAVGPSDMTIYVNPDFIKKLTNYGDKTWIFAHETMHLAFGHPVRTKGKEYPKLFNIAGDAVVNHMLKEFLKCTSAISGFMVSMDKVWRGLRNGINGFKVSHEEITHMAVEEIYKLLLKLPRIQIAINCDLNCPGIPGAGDGKSKGGKGDNQEGQGNDQQKKGRLLQEGDAEIYSEKELLEKAKKWKKAIVKAYAQQKIAGKVPAGLRRLVDGMLESKVPWQSKIKSAYRAGCGKTIIASYKRPSRKHPSLPGIQRYTYPTVHILVDGSGSIGTVELTQFFVEIYEIARKSPVVVYAFDARSYKPIKGRDRREIMSKLTAGIRGGGGTKIGECLQKTLEVMKSKDIVVVLTDGYIWDIDHPSTRDLFSRVAFKSSVAIFASTVKNDPSLLRWHFVKVNIER